MLFSKSIIERQECGCECLDCGRNLGHMHACPALKAYLVARGKTITEEDRDQLFEDFANVHLILNTEVSQRTMQFCVSEFAAGKKRGWKELK